MSEQVRTPERRRFLLAAVGAAVLVPLAALLVFQYRWLVKLEETSTVARLATLENYLDAIAKEVEYAYVKRAERTLNMPSYLVHHSCLVDVAQFFERKKVDGVKRFFIVTYLDEFPGTLYFDGGEERMVLAEEGPEAAAVYLATSDWQSPTSPSRATPSGFYVGDLDRDHPVIFHPIRTSDSELVGLAGMIVDREHFERQVLPAAIEKSLPRQSAGERLSVSVLDAEGREVFAGPADHPGPPAVVKELGFAFAGWRVGLRGRHASPHEWARANFLFNLSLTIVLAAVLFAGLVLALRTVAREMKLSQMKSDFVSNVSHELRTPLASIRVFGELLGLGRIHDGDTVREFGHYVENESRRLTRLVDNILDFSKIESGHRIYDFRPSAIEDVVAEALKAFEAPAARGAEITFTPPAAPLPTLAVDAPALVHAVSNLLENAVKYSGGAPARVAVRLARCDGDVAIEVRDHGIGIAEDDQERIFERFHRVGTGLLHSVKGSGLGLAIVRHIVEAHGGRVTVDSELGRGSSFTIRLPVAATPGRDVETADLNLTESAFGGAS